MALCHSKPQVHCLYNLWCLNDRGVQYALLMRANKPNTDVQGFGLLAPRGLLHHANKTQAALIYSR